MAKRPLKLIFMQIHTDGRDPYEEPHDEFASERGAAIAFHRWAMARPRRGFGEFFRCIRAKSRQDIAACPQGHGPYDRPSEEFDDGRPIEKGFKPSAEALARVAKAGLPKD